MAGDVDGCLIVEAGQIVHASVHALRRRGDGAEVADALAALLLMAELTRDRLETSEQSLAGSNWASAL